MCVNSYPGEDLLSISAAQWRDQQTRSLSTRFFWKSILELKINFVINWPFHGFRRQYQLEPARPRCWPSCSGKVEIFFLNRNPWYICTINMLAWACTYYICSIYAALVYAYVHIWTWQAVTIITTTIITGFHCRWVYLFDVLYLNKLA